MSEFALNASETRTPRPAASRKMVTPLVIAGVGAVALAGFAMAASAVIGDILAPSAKTAPMPMAAAPVIDGGMASQWPDLKDGLPMVAASAAPPTTGALPIAAKVEPTKIEPAKVAALSNGSGPAATLSKVAPSAPARSEAKVAETKPADAKRPEARIPVPTPVAVASPPPTVKPVVPTRSAALVPPRESVRAREEAAPPVTAKHPQAAKPVAEVATPKPEHKPEPAKTREAATEKKATARTATATPAVEKPPKTAAVAKPAPAGHSQDPAKTTVASAEPEETNILGVKLPSLAPAGRKIQESVSALGDAVRNAF